MLTGSSSRCRPGVLAAAVALSFAFGAALLTSVVSAAPASAHATLVSITPAAGAHLTTAPVQVEVEFDEPVSSSFATVVVTGAGGVNAASGKPTVLGAKVTQALSPDLASGDYRIAYRVVSDDGHPVTGESSFTLTLTSSSTTPTSPANGSPSPAATALPAGATPAVEDPNAEQGDGPARFLVPLAGAVALLVIGAGVLRWERQRQ